MDFIPYEEPLLPNCPNCAKNDWVKDGQPRDDQRYRCKACGETTSESKMNKIKVKLSALLDFYINELLAGVPMNELNKKPVAKMTTRTLAAKYDVSPATAATWIKEYNNSPELQKHIEMVFEGGTLTRKKAAK